MTVMSIALLQVERCSAKVATPSDTVNETEFITLPSRVIASRTIDRMTPLTYLVKRPSNQAFVISDHAPYQPSSQERPLAPPEPDDVVTILARMPSFRTFQRRAAAACGAA